MFRRAATRPQPAVAWALVFIAMAGHPANAQTSFGAALVSHDFTESAQGWQIAGDTGTSTPVHRERPGSSKRRVGCSPL